MKINEVIKDIPISKGLSDQLVTEIKFSNGKEISLKKVGTEGLHVLLMWDPTWQLWRSPFQDDIEEVVEEYCHKVYYKLYSDVDTNVVFLYSIISEDVEFVDCIFEQSLIPMIKIGRSRGWKLSNCVVIEDGFA
jgi:hypothetical protein